MIPIKTFVKILVNTIIGLVLILIWLHFVNIKEILTQISKVSLSGLIPVFFFMFLSPFLRALRLKIFLSKIQKINLKDLFFLNGAAMVLNFFIPIRIGEVVKGVFLNTNYGVNLGKAVIWIFLDRFVDFLVVLLSTAILLLVIPTSVSQSIVVTMVVIFAVALFCTYFAIFRAGFAKKIVSFIKHIFILNSIKIYFERLSLFILDSFSILRREHKELTILGILTVLAYGADAAIWYFTFIALGSPQSFIKMYLGQMFSALTYLIPAAPGYVGSAEASGLLILSGIFGIGNNLASAMIVLFHILSALFVIIFGLVSIFSLKLDLGAVFRKAFRKGN